MSSSEQSDSDCEFIREFDNSWLGLIRNLEDIFSPPKQQPEGTALSEPVRSLPVLEKMVTSPAQRVIDSPDLSRPRTLEDSGFEEGSPTLGEITGSRPRSQLRTNSRLERSPPRLEKSDLVAPSKSPHLEAASPSKRKESDKVTPSPKMETSHLVPPAPSSKRLRSGASPARWKRADKVTPPPRLERSGLGTAAPRFIRSHSKTSSRLERLDKGTPSSRLGRSD